jgi:protein Tex
MTLVEYIARSVSVPRKGIENTLSLLSEDCTIPFIARYRKDQTGNLDEVAIEQIAKEAAAFEALEKRREVILAQGALTPELGEKIRGTYDLTELEDLYLPYKKRKKTRADVARENGLEPLARILMAQRNDDVDFLASRYLNDNVRNQDEALQGARDIVAEWVNENTHVRRQLRRLFQRTATLSAKVVKGKADAEAAQKFTQYFDWSEPLSKAPAHRLLAMLRAEKEGFVRTKVDVDADEAFELVARIVIRS